MELCTSLIIPNLPHHHRFLSTKSPHILSQTHLLLKKTTISHRNPGFLYFATPLHGVTTSEETLISANQQFEEEPDGVITAEETFVDEKNVAKVVSTEVPKEETQLGEQAQVSAEVPKEEAQMGEQPQVSTEVPKEEAEMGEQTQAFDFLDKLNIKVSTEVPKEEAQMGEQTQAFDFLDKLNIKIDSEDTYSILLYGSGALVALWLVSAIVGAIDSIPVFPKVMEIVGLSFTIWFSYRYLIFKENRNELSAKIEEFKKQVLGSTDD